MLAQHHAAGWLGWLGWLVGCLFVVDIVVVVVVVVVVLVVLVVVVVIVVAVVVWIKHSGSQALGTLDFRESAIIAGLHPFHYKQYACC